MNPAGGLVMSAVMLDCSVRRRTHVDHGPRTTPSHVNAIGGHDRLLSSVHLPHRERTEKRSLWVRCEPKGTGPMPDGLRLVATGRRTDGGRRKRHADTNRSRSGPVPLSVGRQRPAPTSYRVGISRCAGGAKVLCGRGPLDGAVPFSNKPSAIS